MVIVPKAIDRFTPKVIVKEVPIVKEVIKEVIKEVPVFKSEKIVEKEKVIYTDKRLDLFIIHQIDEDTYVLNIRDSKNPEMVWEINAGFGPQQSGILLHRGKQSRQEYFSQDAGVTANTAGWNQGSL